jgi:hypothetical protein
MGIAASPLLDRRDHPTGHGHERLYGNFAPLGWSPRTSPSFQIADLVTISCAGGYWLFLLLLELPVTRRFNHVRATILGGLT